MPASSFKQYTHAQQRAATVNIIHTATNKYTNYAPTTFYFHFKKKINIEKIKRTTSSRVSIHPVEPKEQMTHSPPSLLLIIILLLTFAPHLGSASSSRRASLLSKNATPIGNDESSSSEIAQQQQQQQRLHLQQQQKRIQQPSNTNDPDYIHPFSHGGNLNQPGHDGLIIFSTQLGGGSSSRSNVNDKEVKAYYFFVTDNYDGSSSSSSNNENKVEDEANVQYYIVPSNDNGRNSSASSSSGERREVTIKAWGGGGGGCDGGRKMKIVTTDEDANAIVNDNTNDTSNINDSNSYSVGSGGHYIKSTFLLPVGEKLKVVIGGGGKSSHSRSHSLGGRGGYNGGYPGREDGFSGGGGGGGYSHVSLARNGTVLLAAYGGDGGGNAAYCTAHGGPGGRLLGRKSKKKVDDDDDGGGGYYIAHDLAMPSSSYHAIVCLSVPSITEMTHNSATFIWNAGPCQRERKKELYVHKYAAPSRPPLLVCPLMEIGSFQFQWLSQQRTLLPSWRITMDDCWTGN